MKIKGAPSAASVHPGATGEMRKYSLNKKEFDHFCVALP